jgi:hypothetical protein
VQYPAASIIDLRAASDNGARPKFV